MKPLVDGCIVVSSKDRKASGSCREVRVSARRGSPALAAPYREAARGPIVVTSRRQLYLEKFADLIGHSGSAAVRVASIATRGRHTRGFR